MTFVLPRLDRDQAAGLITAARADHSPADISGRLPDTTVETVWPAVGDARVSDEALRALRGSVLELATSHHFPGPGRQLPAFDAAAARLIRGALDLTPHEASHEAAWTYLTCCWLLDIAVWRFGTGTDTARFIGDVNRNTFRRLWWRAEILGDDVDLSRFGEDEIFNIMERPTLTADPFVARTVAAEFLAVVDARPGIARTRLIRDATKRLLRLTPFVDLSCLDDRQLVDSVRLCFAQATSALTGEPVPTPGRDSISHRAAPSPEVTVVTRVTLTPEPALPRDGAPQEPFGVRPGPAMPPPPMREEDADRPAAASTPMTGDQVGLIAADLAARTGRVTNQTLRDALGITREEALRILTRETQRGSLEKHGARRGTYYSLPAAGQSTTDLERTAQETDDDPATGAASGSSRSNRTLLSRLLNRRP